MYKKKSQAFQDIVRGNVKLEVPARGGSPGGVPQPVTAAIVALAVAGAGVDITVPSILC